VRTRGGTTRCTNALAFVRGDTRGYDDEIGDYLVTRVISAFVADEIGSRNPAPLNGFIRPHRESSRLENPELLIAIRYIYIYIYKYYFPLA